MSAKHITINPFLNPSNNPDNIEYAVLGNAGIVILVKRKMKIPRGANAPISSILSFSFSIPNTCMQYIVNITDDNIRISLKALFSACVF